MIIRKDVLAVFKTVSRRVPAEAINFLRHSRKTVAVGARRDARNVSWTARGVSVAAAAAAKRYNAARCHAVRRYGTARPAKTQPSCLKRDERHATVTDPRRTVAPASPCCPGTPTLLIPTAGYRECPRAKEERSSLAPLPRF